MKPHPLLAGLVDRDSITYSVQVKPKDKWNLLVGGNWKINMRRSLTAEVDSLLDRFQNIGGVIDGGTLRRRGYTI